MSKILEFQSFQTGKFFQVKGDFVEALKIVENTCFSGPLRFLGDAGCQSGS